MVLSPAERLDVLCDYCRHTLRAHQAQEGMCLECDCLGWSSRIFAEAERLRAQRDAVLALCDEADRDRAEMIAGRLTAMTRRFSVGYIDKREIRRALGVTE